MMDLYTLSIKVTFDQELAIQSLFEHRGWTFHKLGMHVTSKYDRNNEEKKSVYSEQLNNEKCIQPCSPGTQLEDYSSSGSNHGSNSYHLTLMGDQRSASTQASCVEMQSDSPHTSTESQKQNRESNTESNDNISNPSVDNSSQNVNLSLTDLSSSQKNTSSSEPSSPSSTYYHLPTTSLHTELPGKNCLPMSVSLNNQKHFNSNHELALASTVEKILHLLMAAFNLNFDEHLMKTELNKILKCSVVEKVHTNSAINKYMNRDRTVEDSDNYCDTEMATDRMFSTHSLERNLDSSGSVGERHIECGDTNIKKNTPKIFTTKRIKKDIDWENSESLEADRNDIQKQATDDTMEVEDDITFPLCNDRPEGNKRPKKSYGRKVKSDTKLSFSPTSKFRWTVNRNLRMHKYHRKCRTLPVDLNKDMYSASEKGYYCPDCQFIFIRKNKLVLHKQLKSGNCLPDCIYCDAEEEHKEVYQCDKCPKCFPTSEMLERHLAKHAQNLFCCHICDAQFYTIVELKVHMQSTHSDVIQQEHLCDLCGSKFKEKKVLNAHVKYVHSENRPEQCSLCDKSFKTKSQLKNHLVTHQSVSDLNLSCEVCGRGFLRKATLKEHVRRHKKEFTIFCTVCGKGFYRHYDLEEHMRVHTGDKPFDCKYCGFKCALSCNLAKHMKVHQKQGLIVK